MLGNNTWTIFEKDYITSNRNKFVENHTVREQTTEKKKKKKEDNVCIQISHINYIFAYLSFLQAYYHLKIQASLSNFVYHQ